MLFAQFIAQQNNMEKHLVTWYCLEEVCDSVGEAPLYIH